MGSKKCLIKDCGSEEGNEGITFHRFPNSNPDHYDRWKKACKIESGFKPNKHHFVCSQHFRRENFTILNSGKIILKNLTVPSIFPWNKDTVKVTKSTITISDSDTPTKKQKKDDKTKEKPTEKEVSEENASKDTENSTTPVQKEEETKIDSSKKKNSSTSKKKANLKKTPSSTTAAETPKTEPSPQKAKKSSKRLSARYEQAEIQAKKIKLETTPASEKKPVKTSKVKEEPKHSETPSSSVSSSTTAQGKQSAISFLPGNSIEVKNFDGKWITVKIIEVDMDEREVFVRSCEKNKSKPGLNDEWISMESPRLRPAQPAVTFEVGEKVLARWNDCRKFAATIQRVLENDTYDVLFDDGYPKIVRGVHIQKYNSKIAAKTQPPEVAVPQTPINPLLLNPPSLLPDYIKEMKDELPQALTGENGEWCCVWVDDIPVGEESHFEATFGKCPSIIIRDARLKEGWQKHIYLRQNGKWDVLFISPTNKRLRFKNELKAYLAEIGEIYDPNVWDFSLHKKVSKAKNMCIQSEKLKQHQAMSTSFDVKTESGESQAFLNPFANLGALPYVQPNLVQAPPTQNEVSVGSLKVKVIDNNYHCPDEKCDKTFRKENHLQIHIKHYHLELAKLMGECPNMEDLAYLRTTVDDTEIAMVKSNRKSHGPKDVKPKTTPKSESNQNGIRDFSIKIEKLSAQDFKFNVQRSPILEEALKAPLITTSIQPQVKDMDMSNETLSAANFDPESLIPPHAVARPNMKAHKRKIRIRFNPKTKKSNSKKQIEYFRSKSDATGSTVEGVIPYHEGPYFKNQHQTSYVDENGEVIKIVRMKKEEIINCICGFGEEDGLMIQCDLCLCWQHGICHNIEKSHQVPDKHVCFICKNPYRQRLSTRFIHDQDWLFDGKLPIANYHVENPKQTARFDTLKQCHTLIGNLIEMKKFINSLDVKINIAENSEHPKLYLWAKKWEESPPREKSSDNDAKDDIKLEEDIKMPIAPEPEAAIEPKKCQQTLLDHIEFQQNNIKSRLDMIENEISGLEDDALAKIPNGKKPIDDATLKSTIYMLIKDLKQINNFADIHRNPLPETEEL